MKIHFWTKHNFTAYLETFDVGKHDPIIIKNLGFKWGKAGSLKVVIYFFTTEYKFEAIIGNKC